jgi:hypothetical protein
MQPLENRGLSVTFPASSGRQVCAIRDLWQAANNDQLEPRVLKRIHVNMHVIRRNHKTGDRDPPLSVKTSGGSHQALRIEIEGPATVVYSPDKPLPCGARVWIETTSPTRLTTDIGDLNLA